MTVRASGSDSYILCELAGATYAIRSDDILQLEMVAEPTPVPNAPRYVEGVISVRGQVIPVLSLRGRFGFPDAPRDIRTRLVIVRSRGRTVGLVVDSAREFAAIAEDAIQPVPDGVTGLSGRYLRGLAQRGERLVLILDVPGLLAADDRSIPTPTPATERSASVAAQP